MKINHQMHLNKKFHDLNPVVAGEAQLTPNHRTTCSDPHNTFTVVHYMVSGTGTLYCWGDEIPVHAGQIFIFFPGESGHFQPDKEVECTYRWVGFIGSLSPAFAALMV